MTEEIVLHVTHADTMPDPYVAGGSWGAMCLTEGCAWFETGPYLFDQHEPAALRLAHTYGTVHEHKMNLVHERSRGTA
jgi:hypothetical protein